jgi:hypothetical protein
MTDTRHLNRWTVLLFICTSGVLVSTTAWAQDEAFKKGFDAINDQRWADAAAGMEGAIKADPKESVRKIRVGGFGIGRVRVAGDETEYLPFFYLGQAQFNRKNCSAAISAWETSEQHGVIKTRSDLLSIMQEGYRACAAQGFLLAADFRTASGATRQAYDGAIVMAKNVYGLMEKHPGIVRAEAREQYGRAQNELTNASDRLKQALGTRSRSDFDEARAMATRAADLLRPIEAAIITAAATAMRVGSLVSEITQMINRAEATAQSIDAVTVPVPKELHASTVKAREQLALARERLAFGERSQNPAALDEALKYATSASASFNEALDQVRRLAAGVHEENLKAALKSAEEAFAFVDASIASLARLEVEGKTSTDPHFAQSREAIRKDLETQRRAFARARTTKDIAAVERVTRSVERHRGTLDDMIRSFGPVTLRDRGVDDALVAGARLFFEGDYRKSLAALSPAGALSNIRLQLHVHLFRAAASYSLWALSAGTDEAMRDAAYTEIKWCRQLNAAFEPDPRMFSPAFIAFYRQAGADPPRGAASNAPAR